MLYNGMKSTLLIIVGSFIFTWHAIAVTKEGNFKGKEVSNEKKQAEQPKRPQEPKPPYPYYQEEVRYENKVDGITISGTLTLPSQDGQFPVALLVAGMGPQDRDYNMMGHKLFLLLADYLTRRGVAVLRVDKRGVGKSTGTFNETVTSKDLTRDVRAGVEYLKTRKEINPKQIGLIGHSEGGMIVPMVACDSEDVAFLVLLAGVATTSAENVIKQTAMQLRADGATNEMIAFDSKIREQLLNIVMSEDDPSIAEPQMREAIAEYLQVLPSEFKEESKKLLFALKEENADSFVSMFNSPSYRYWLAHDPVAILKQVSVPVLALNGELDFIAVSKIALPLIAGAFEDAGNADAETRELPSLNHWFQKAESGSIMEYGMLEETMSPKVLKMVADWISERFTN